MLKLGVNIDHVATLRQARGVDYPDPLEAALAAEKAGADAITLHLREDRRHIADRDLFRIASAIKVRINQELAPTGEMVELALKVKPDEVCFVPERREELTTEGGLDVVGLVDRLAPMIRRLREVRVGISLFVEPDQKQLAAAKSVGANSVELHTGTYASLADHDFADPAPPHLGTGRKNPGRVAADSRRSQGGARSGLEGKRGPRTQLCKCWPHCGDHGSAMAAHRTLDNRPFGDGGNRAGGA